MKTETARKSQTLKYAWKTWARTKRSTRNIRRNWLRASDCLSEGYRFESDTHDWRPQMVVRTFFQQ